jgi:hypothetical protein
MNTLNETLTALTNIQEYAEKNLITEEVVSVPNDLPIGAYCAQGDLNIWRIEKIPYGFKPTAVKQQLAIGNTKGSRHCLREEDLANVEAYESDATNPLIGQVLVLKEDIVITHPEHKHQRWPKGFIIGITYQRQFAEELRRVVD